MTADIAKLLVKNKIDKSRVGVDSFRFWPVFEYQELLRLCPKIQMVDSHRLFGEIRGPKSAEELAQITRAIQISDIAHYTFLANLKSGLTEEAVAGKAVDVLNSFDVGDRIILIHSQPEAVFPIRPSRNIIQKPNPVTFSPEFTRNKGYGAQMIRAYWWEQPKGIYKKMFTLWAEMRQMVVEEFKPGS